jgi:hypothetical protein
MTPAQALAMAILALEAEAGEAARQCGYRGARARECREAAKTLEILRERLADTGLYESD